MSILATGVMYGALGALSEFIVILIRRLVPDRPGQPPRNLRGLRLVVVVLVMFGGSSVLRPRVEEWEAMNTFNRGLRSEPSFLVIAKCHPDLVARMQADVRSGIHKWKTSGDYSQFHAAALSALKPIYADLFPRYAQSMPNREVVEFWRTWFQRFKDAAKQDSSAAVDALAGDGELKVDAASHTALGVAAMRAIAAAIRTPVQSPDSTVAEATRRALIGRLSDRFGSGVFMLADPMSPTFNRSVAQAVVLSFWDELFAFPDDEAGPFLKQNAPLDSAIFIR